MSRIKVQLSLQQERMFYKGYSGSINTHPTGKKLYGRICGIEDDVKFTGVNIDELIDNFILAVDNHVKDLFSKRLINVG